MLNTETIQITPELLTLLSEIDEFKGACSCFQRLRLARISHRIRTKRGGLENRPVDQNVLALDAKGNTHAAANAQGGKAFFGVPTLHFI